jgi:hypothetical protein
MENHLEIERYRIRIYIYQLQCLDYYIFLLSLEYKELSYFTLYINSLQIHILRNYKFLTTTF